MSISFSRSVRSLHQDSFRPTVVSISIIVALLVAWGAWFTLAPINIYEQGSDLHTGRNGEVLARFSASAMKRLHPGQSAELHVPANADTPAKTFQAMVMQVVPAQPDQAGQARLYIFGQSPRTLDSAARVEVVVEQVAPITMLMRNNGVNTAATSSLQQGEQP